MNPFDYAFGLISIVIGLAIGDMAISLHKLLRHRGTVRWDARVVLSAAYVFLVVTGMWFQVWSIRDRVDILGYGLFLTMVIELLAVFLAAAAVMPDEPVADTDLAVFYAADARYIWTLVALFNASYLAHWVYFVAITHRLTGAKLLQIAIEGALPLALTTLLAVRPGPRWLHLLTIGALIALQFYGLWGATLD